MNAKILVAFLAIALVWALAVPSMIQAREEKLTKCCIANLKQIDSAKMQYAMDNHLKVGASVPTGILWSKDGYIKREPQCPDAGVYTIGDIGVNPSCSLGDKNTGVWNVPPSDHRLD